jgi:hypothetical protein
MKIKIEVEIDTESEQDLNTIEEIVEKLQDLAEIFHKTD